MSELYYLGHINVSSEKIRDDLVCVLLLCLPHHYHRWPRTGRRGCRPLGFHRWRRRPGCRWGRNTWKVDGDPLVPVALGLDGIQGLADLPREVGQGRAMILLPLKHQIGVVVPLVHLHYHLLLDHVPLIRVKHKPVRGLDTSNHCCLLHRDWSLLIHWDRLIPMVDVVLVRCPEGAHT